MSEQPPRPPMPPCCIHSFVAKGFREKFYPAEPGSTHMCEVCHRLYVCDRTWREIAGPVAPLKIEDSDVA